MFSFSSQILKHKLFSGKGNKKKIAKDLLRVKRALKTLGVNIIEFDDQESGDASCNRYVLFIFVIVYLHEMYPMY